MLDEKINTQTNINSQYGQAIGNNYGTINNVPNSYLKDLVHDLREQMQNDIMVEEIIYKLNYLLSDSEEFEPMDLQLKLKIANREKEFNEAVRLKEQIAKCIDKYSSYEAANSYFSHILYKVLYDFRNYIYPLIKKDKSQDEINTAIYELVVRPVFNEIERGENFFRFDLSDIRGLVFFLTGNCHLWFDKGHI